MPLLPERAIEEPHTVAATQRDTLQHDSYLVARSARMRAFMTALRLVSDVPGQPIFVEGESGAGKTEAARTIHAIRRGGGRPFQRILMTGFPESIVAAELFGSRRGGFTGALDRPGRLRDAHEGTVFLDEIAKSGVAVQASLLEFLDERVFTAVGGRTPVQIDADVVAASNCDLVAEAVAGRVLPDFANRFVGFTLRLPPLRERSEDIPELLGRCLTRSAQIAGAARVPTVSPELLQLLVKAIWPENIRGLLHAARLLLAAARGARCVDVEHLSPNVIDCMGRSPRRSGRYTDSEIVATVAALGGNQSLAARLLGIHRRTVARCMRRVRDAER